MQNQRRSLGINWFDFIKNEEVSRISGLPPTDVVISQRRHSLFDHLRRMEFTCACSPSSTPCCQHTVWLEARQQVGEDHEDVRAIPRSSRSSPTTSPYLMPGLLQRVGRCGGRYDPAMVKYILYVCVDSSKVEQFKSPKRSTAQTQF